ncbi:hypothetical protein Tco_0778037 [Tanacetum coccineum]
MTTPVIDLSLPHSVSTSVHAPLPTSTTTTTTIITTTSLPPPPPQPQQSIRDPMLLKRIGELEQHMEDLIQENLALEERDLPTVDMKEIFQQRMFEDNSYKAHDVHNDLYEALQKSLELDYSNQRLADQEEAGKMKRKRRESPITPPGSPPSQPPPPPPPTGASGAPGSSQQQGGKAPSSSKTTASTHQSMAWTTSDTRYGSTGFTATHETSPLDDLMHDDSIPDEQASALVSTYEPPAENSLLAKTGDMTTFINWYCRQVNKIVLTQADFEGQAYEVVKAFYPDVVQLQFQMEECHKMFTDQVDWMNPEGDQVRIDVNRPLPLGGPPGHVTILTQFFFNKDLEYLRYGSKGSSPALSIFKIKAASYQTQLNLTKSGWDATGYEFKHDYTIIESPRAVVFPVNNNERKIMRFNKIYKFSDGTLTRILEVLDYKVKEFKVKRLNPGMNTQFWTQKDVTRSKEFLAAIEKRLKTRRIYQNLECFVGGRVRDIDYRLLQRTK